ncbi:MAG: hypothetical protein SF187_00575 [Deltaproteobacteria bacterium]|nr:hypothetical protein [Deltaproteobacteria bacterium]
MKALLIHLPAGTFELRKAQGATKPAFVKALLDHGADPNLVGADGLRPLDYAYENKQSAEKIALLIERGAKTKKYAEPL